MRAFFVAMLVLWAVSTGFEIGSWGRRELVDMPAGFAFFQAANTAVSRDPLFVNTAVSLLHSSLTSTSDFAKELAYVRFRFRRIGSLSPGWGPPVGFQARKATSRRSNPSGRRRGEGASRLACGRVGLSARHDAPMPPLRRAAGDTSAFFVATLVLWAVSVGFEIGARSRRELVAMAAGFAFFQAAITAAVSRDPPFVNTARGHSMS
ncbi:uncharacterized protein [Triticum aestivum]|uniref:uncharacterized protein n=1 Tax=Triticum aestivum TaxID=4565 RepID=UPI001D01C015|nr:uncharacterized protein LOC123067668 [Triticum aestivum]